MGWTLLHGQRQLVSMQMQLQSSWQPWTSSRHITLAASSLPRWEQHALERVPVEERDKHQTSTNSKPDRNAPHQTWCSGSSSEQVESHRCDVSGRARCVGAGGMAKSAQGCLGNGGHIFCQWLYSFVSDNIINTCHTSPLLQ